jgi:hypothetical protein
MAISFAPDSETLVSTGGLIVAQDADLSDLSIDYLRSLSVDSEDITQPQALQPWVVVNEWNCQCESPTGTLRDRSIVHYYDTPTPSRSGLGQRWQRGSMFPCGLTAAIEVG